MGQTLFAKMRIYRWFIFVVLALAYFFVYFHRFSSSVVASDLMRDFNVDAGALGVFVSIYFYCYAVTQIPAGVLSDSVGPRRTVTYSLAIAAVGSFLFALAPNIRVAMVARGLVGLGVSMVFIPALKLLSQWFRPKEFSLMSGLLNAAGGLGILGATWVLGILATLAGWRLSFHVIAACTAGIIVAAWLILRDRPMDLGWPSMAQIEGLPEGEGPAPAKTGCWQGARRVAFERAFWPVAIWFFFDCGIFFGFGGLWSGRYLQDTYGMNKEQSGAVLGMIAWGMILGGPLLGWVSQRVLRSRCVTLRLCMILLTALLLFLTLFPSGLPRPVLAAWFLLFSVSSSAAVAVAFTTTKELFPIEIAGTAVGMVNFFPFLGGALFMPALGRVLDAYGPGGAHAYPVAAYRTILGILLAAALMSLGCTFRMKETCKR
jgi:sugar phosphate permease